MDAIIYQKIDKLQEKSVKVSKNSYKDADAVRRAKLWHLIEDEIDNLYVIPKALNLTERKTFGRKLRQ